MSEEIKKFVQNNKKSLERCKVLKKVKDKYIIRCNNNHTHQYLEVNIKICDAKGENLKCPTCSQKLKTFDNLRVALEEVFKSPFMMLDDKKMGEDVGFYSVEKKILVFFFKKININNKKVKDNVECEYEKRNDGVIIVKLHAATYHIQHKQLFYKLRYVRGIAEGSGENEGVQKSFSHLVGKYVRRKLPINMSLPEIESQTIAKLPKKDFEQELLKKLY